MGCLLFANTFLGFRIFFFNKTLYIDDQLYVMKDKTK